MNHSMSGKHGLIMLLCCLIPLVGFFLVSSFNISVSGLGTIAMVLLCPLLHILMMRGMMSHGKDGQASCHDTKSEQPRALPAEAGKS